MITYQEAEQYISDIPKFAGKHTLEDTQRLLALLTGNTIKSKIIHVAGTNGNFFTEGWEVIAVPTVADTKSAIVYNGLPTSGNKWRSDNNSAYSPVLGYMTSSGFESAYIQY